MGYERFDRFRDRPQAEDRGYRDRSAYAQDRHARSDRFAGQQERYRRDAGRPADYEYDDRGFFARAGDEVRSWFGDDEAERRREYDHRYDDRHDRERGYDDRPGYGGGGRAGGYGGVGGYGGAGGYGGYAGSGRHDSPAAGDYGSVGAFRGDWRERDRFGRGRQRDDDARGSYVDWRERQNDVFDRDYDEYRREHQSRFDNDFGTWRARRETQRGSLGQVTEHMEVVGADGVHVGKVDKVRGDRVILTRSDQDAHGHHHSIPSRWIDRVDERVVLEKTAAEAQAAWRDEENRTALFGDDREARDAGTGGYVFSRSIYTTY